MINTIKIDTVVRDLFAQYDANRDGKIGLARPLSTPPSVAVEQRGLVNVSRAEAGPSQLGAVDEYVRTHRLSTGTYACSAAKLFVDADKDRDGTVTRAELRAHIASFDRDGDGALSLTRVRKHFFVEAQRSGELNDFNEAYGNRTGKYPEYGVGFGETCRRTK